MPQSRITKQKVATGDSRNPSTSPIYDSVEELATELRVSRQLAYRHLNDGTIPCIRIGKRIVISREAIAEWLKTSGSPLQNRKQAA